MPFISIIIPVYNASKYIKRCLYSIFDNSFSDYEIILINDGSTDDSLSICQQFKDKRLTIISQQNQGVSTTRNTGLRHAKGKWISFIDADDFIKKNYLETLALDAINNPDAKLIQSGFYNSFERENTVVEQQYPDLLSKDALYNINQIRGIMHGKLFLRKIINEHNIEFDCNMIISEDIAFTMDYLIHVDYVKFSSYIGYFYRRHNQSTTGKKQIFPTYNLLTGASHIYTKYNEYCTINSIQIPLKLRRIISGKYWEIIRSLYLNHIVKPDRLNVLSSIVNDSNHCYLNDLKSGKIQHILSNILIKTNISIFDRIMLLLTKFR